MAARSSLWKLSALLLPLSLALYLLSLAMDVATSVNTIAVFGVSRSSEEPYRLLSTIRRLYEEREWILAIAITAFTIVFPIAKYVGLAFVMIARGHGARERVLGWIKNWGQWSMGDVFVVALLVVILRINTAGVSLSVRVEPGLYVFAASVILSMIASVLLAIDENAVQRRKDAARAAERL